MKGDPQKTQSSPNLASELPRERYPGTKAGNEALHFCDELTGSVFENSTPASENNWTGKRGGHDRKTAKLVVCEKEFWTYDGVEIAVNA